MSPLVKALGLGNAVMFGLAALLVLAPAGMAAEQDADKGCWRIDAERNELYCCSWVVCNCNIFEFGECTA